ncbi:MAG: alpha-glucosidase [Clostridiales bacterium]|nr:alpha-glucosidase [Clostridiales bacterium]
MLTIDNRIKDVYANPVGHDIIQEILLQMGHGDIIIKNPIIGNIKLKALPKLSMGHVDKSLLDTLLELVNSETDVPKSDDGPVAHAWWKEAVFYQVYPRSFKDSNNDGIGDLGGILEKLDYIKGLGVDAIWLSPIYDSPNDDNGYDIRDYRKIMTEFGDMEDFDELIEGIHSRGMKLIMDLVVNHTSDEHEWFKKAVREPNSKYGNYYIFRDKPNNWTSLFGGSAWGYFKERHQYALHLFSKKQMDLNWENPDVRNEIIDMVRWWLQKGVDGFRMDVINFISKRHGLPDGNEKIGALMGFYGAEHYFYGPHLHQYLREIKSKALAPFNAFSVGETPGIGMEMSKLLTSDYRRELDMVFSFDHLETPGHTRFDDYRYDLNYYKKYIINWMQNYGSHCQMSLFYENHDNPRRISKVDTDPRFRIVLAKLLAAMQLTLRGTPFIYQGQELGMVNKHFTSIDQLRDVESKNLYNELCKKMSKEDAFKKVLAGARDHARTPMQWTDDKYAGFSDVEPWIGTDSDCKICNAKAQVSDDNSVLNFYRNLISLRREHNALIYGDIKITNKKQRDLFTYYRIGQDETFYIECNLSREEKKRKGKLPNAILLISNYPEVSNIKFRPYEADVWMLNNPR